MFFIPPFPAALPSPSGSPAPGPLFPFEWVDQGQPINVLEIGCVARHQRHAMGQGSGGDEGVTQTDGGTAAEGDGCFGLLPLQGKFPQPGQQVGGIQAALVDMSVPPQ